MGPMLWQVRAAAGDGHTPGDDSDSDERKSIIDHFMGSMLWWAVNLEGDGYTQGEESDRDERPKNRLPIVCSYFSDDIIFYNHLGD